MSAVPYPWHRQAWAGIEHALRNNRLPHALLLHAPPGSGMGHFGCLLQERVLATGVDGQVDAHQAHLARVGTHPDLYQLRPEKEGGVITVDQVRGLIDFMQLSSRGGGRRVACIRPAEAMNRNACNCLLKILEEPPGPALLLLQAHRPYMLPATVLSRTVRVSLVAGDQGAVRSWLKEQGRDVRMAEWAALLGVGPLDPDGVTGEKGRAISAKIYAELCPSDTLPAVPATAERWQALGAAQVLQWLAAGARLLVRDRLRADTAGAAPQGLRQAGAGLNLLALVQFHDKINKNSGLLSVAGTSERALLEDSLLAWRSLTQTTGRGTGIDDSQQVIPDAGR